jgi:hypothetical protein
MSLFAMDMPESHADLIDWLEQHLVGLELASLVAELKAVHGRPEAAPSLEGLLGDQLAPVLEEGLGVLSPPLLTRLLTSPERLLDLQERVLLEGGMHWQKRIDECPDEELDRIASRSWQQIRRVTSHPPGLASSAAVATAVDTVTGESRTEVAPVVSQSPVSRSSAPSRPKEQRSWRTLLAAAAILLLGFLGLHEAGLLAPRPDVDPGQAPVLAASPDWGWQRPGAIPAVGTPQTYLNTLADGAHEWFKARPADAAGVRERISKFREGCSTLIASTHDPLAAADRKWIVEKCLAWRDKLDQHLAALDAGADPLQVRAQADETVTNLIRALRTRSSELG